MADTNVEYLKKHGLYNAHKEFMRIVEGYGYASPIEEAPDNEDGNQDGSPDATAPMDGADNANGGNNMMGGPDANAANPMGNANGADMGNTNGADMGMQGDPDVMGGPDAQSNAMPPTGNEGDEDPMGGMGDVPPMADDSGTGEDSKNDDDVIDVDNIVKAQEKNNDKINQVGRDLGTVDKRIEKLLNALEDMQGVIDKNNAEISDLRNEFEKRNPTQTEKLNLRSLDSYPFNVSPVDYWKQKGIDSNYSAYADNDEPTDKEYVITNDDVDDIDSNIDKTFSIPDEDQQDINKIFGIR